MFIFTDNGDTNMGHLFGKDFEISIEFVKYPKEVLLMEDVERLVIIKNGSDGILAWVNRAKTKCPEARRFAIGGFRFEQVCETCGLGIQSTFRFNDEEELALDQASDDDKNIKRAIQKSCMERMRRASNDVWKNIFAMCNDMGLENLFVRSSNGQKNIIKKGGDK